MKKLILIFSLLFLVLLPACGGKTDMLQSKVKYETYNNERYNYTVEYPSFLIPQDEATNQDGQIFLSEDQKIKLMVYYEFKIDFNSDGEHLSIGEAYEEDLKFKGGAFYKEFKGNQYIIEYKVDEMLHSDYVRLYDDNYFNIRFEYPEKEKEMMKGVIEHVTNSFKLVNS